MSNNKPSYFWGSLHNDPSGNGGEYVFACNHIYFGPSQKAQFMALNTELFTQQLNEACGNDKLIDVTFKDSIKKYIDDLYPNTKFGDSLKNNLNSQTNYNSPYRQIILADAIKHLNEKIQGDLKDLLAHGYTCMNYDISNGYERTTSRGGGRMGIRTTYNSIKDALSDPDIKKIYSNFTKLLLEDILFKINRTVNSDEDQIVKEIKLFALFKKASIVNIYDDLDDDYINNINNILSNINQLRANNILPINITSINNSLEETINIVNENGSNEFYLLPNNALLNKFKIETTSYSGFLNFRQSIGNKYELYFSANLATSDYSKSIAENYLKGNNGSYKGTFAKLLFTKDVKYHIPGIDPINSYIVFTNNHLYAKITFKDLASQETQFPIMITSGLPITIHWQYANNLNFNGDLNLVLKLNQFDQTDLTVENNRVINRSRFNAKIKYVIYKNNYLSSGIILKPNEEIPLSRLASDIVNLRIPNDGIEYDISHVNNPFYLLKNGDLITQVNFKNNFSIKNGSQLRKLVLEIILTDNSKMNLEFNPFEDRTISIPYQNVNNHNIKITGNAIYTDGSIYRIKPIESSESVIQFDDSTLEN